MLGRLILAAKHCRTQLRRNDRAKDAARSAWLRRIRA
jgi:hypothetical protein